MLLELEGSYWISLSVIALFENVNQTTKISCSRDEKQQKDAQAAEFFLHKRHFESSPTWWAAYVYLRGVF